MWELGKCNRDRRKPRTGAGQCSYNTQAKCHRQGDWGICPGKIGQNNTIPTAMGTTDGLRVEDGLCWEEELKWFSGLSGEETAPFGGAQEFPSQKK